MVTSLSVGEKVHVGDSVTLTVLAVEGDLIRLAVESSGPGDPGASVLIEGRDEPAFRWWELN
jgi:hypothetical protein